MMRSLSLCGTSLHSPSSRVHGSINQPPRSLNTQHLDSYNDSLLSPMPIITMRDKLTFPVPQLPNPRSSFSVERRPDNHHLASPPLPQSQTSNDFRPHQMQQFPPPNPGLSPPQVQHLPSDQRLPNIPQYQGQGPGQRMVSQPFPTSASAGSDFGPYPNPNMPKSQSMGFPQSRSGVSIPETHPYRGFLNAQQEKDQQQQQRPYQGQSQGYAVPRSISGPIDKLQPPIPPANPAITVNGNSGHSTPNTSEHFTGEEGSSGGSTQQPHPTTDAQTPPASANTSTGKGDGPPQPAWQRDFNAVVDLIGSQPSKHYVASPPELEMILARTSAGSQPKYVDVLIGSEQALTQQARSTRECHQRLGSGLAPAFRYLPFDVVDEGNPRRCCQGRESPSHLLQHHRLVSRTLSASPSSTASTDFSSSSSRLLTQYRWVKSPSLLLSFRARSRKVVIGVAPCRMGTSEAGGDLHRALDQGRWARACVWTHEG